MKYSLLSFAFISFWFFQSAAISSEPLHGHTEKRHLPRVQRPSEPDQKQPSKPIDAQIDASQFRLNTDQTPTLSSPAEGSTEFRSTPLSQKGGATTGNPGGNPKKIPPEQTGVSSGEDYLCDEEKERKRNKNHRVWIHLTGYDEADEVTATINRDALNMAQALAAIGVKITIFLDRSAVKLGLRGAKEFSIKNTPVYFSKLLDNVRAAGGEILANDNYVREYGANLGSPREGIIAADAKTIARGIIKAHQILDYAGPVFPAVYTGPVKKGSMLPDPGCGCGGIEDLYKKYGNIKQP